MQNPDIGISYGLVLVFEVTIFCRSSPSWFGYPYRLFKISQYITATDQQEVVYDLSDGANFNDLNDPWPRMFQVQAIRR